MAVARGTQFEQLTLNLLSQQKFKLRRVGGRSDGGIDLRGSIDLRNEWNVFVQCKCESSKAGPRYIRELEGVLSTEMNAFGVLATANAWTTESRQRFLYSKYSMMGIVIAEDRIQNMWLNYSLQRQIPGLSCSRYALYYHGISQRCDSFERGG
jgi:predicted helicase